MDNNKCWQRCREMEPSSIACGNVRWYKHFGTETVWKFQELTIELSLDSAILLLGTYPRAMKTCPPKDSHANTHNSIT